MSRTATLCFWAEEREVVGWLRVDGIGKSLWDLMMSGILLLNSHLVETPMCLK